MEKKFKRTTVTSALPYANGPVHIGHLAGVYVPADIYVRYLRLKKEDVLFIGGSDEHGVPITILAKKEGVSSIHVPPHPPITSWLRTSFGHSTIKESSLNVPPNSTTMRKRRLSLPTATSQASVLIAMRKELTATNVRNAAPHSHLPN